MTSELIKKLEAATGPDINLDGEIYCAVNGLAFRSVNKDGSIHFEPDKNGTHTMVTPHPYTESIDRAMTLVPERGDNGLYWRCILERKPVHTGPAWIAEIREHAKDGGYAIAHSAALAICAAALRAKSPSTKEE